MLCHESSVSSSPIGFQQKASTSDFLAEVKAPLDVVVPAGHKKQVRCRVKASTGGDDLPQNLR